MSKNDSHETKSFIIEALNTLLNTHDFAAAARFWSGDYIQHSAGIGPGRDGLFNFVRASPALRYEVGVIVAEGDKVFVHGRLTGVGPRSLIAADLFRIEDGLLKEHWDVLQEEATAEESESGLPMFGDRFPSSR